MNPINVFGRLLRLRGLSAAELATRRLLNVIHDESSDTTQLPGQIDAAETLRQACPQHFGITFALGLACELQASRIHWNDRADWLLRATNYYESALGEALLGHVAGSNLVPEVSSAEWPSCSPLQQRAILAAAFEAGRLRAAEFRVRDPERAIHHLQRVRDATTTYHQAWYFLGEAYLLNGQFDRAEHVWRDALRHAPDDGTLQAVLANLPVDRVHHAVKREDWRAVLQETSRLPPGAMPEAERLTIEGDAHHALGAPDAARACWLAALEADRLTVGVRRRLRLLAKAERRLAEQTREPFSHRLAPDKVL